MRRFIGLALSAALAVSGLLALGTGAAQASVGTGTKISLASTPFGPALVVGNGKYKGFSLYTITSDNSPSSFGCTTTVLHLGGMSLSCTGPSNDKTAVWPAITTTGAPVAGRGVHQNLLGTVHRTGVGTQVTYAGRPLYMFDDAPNQVTGEGFDDPASPLPHGVWNLVRPDGRQLPWVATLTTVRIGGHRHLAVLMFTFLGWVKFPVYTASGPCTGACARAWPYVLTASWPGVTGGARPGQVGLTSTPLGVQVTYHGRPLYLFAQENLNFGTAKAAGNGNGVGGFSFVSP
jgi:predicted lipoprotein with Yx(FWY)xxD motif